MAALMTPVAFLQLGSPTSVTWFDGGVDPANTATPPVGFVLTTAMVTEPLPFTVALGVNVMFIEGTSPVCRLLSVTLNSRGTAEMTGHEKILGGVVAGRESIGNKYLQA